MMSGSGTSGLTLRNHFSRFISMYPSRTHRGRVRARMMFRLFRRASFALRCLISMARRKVNWSSLKLQGLAMKSKAPCLMDSAAASMVAQPDIKIMMVSGLLVLMDCKNSMPLMSGSLGSTRAMCGCCCFISFRPF